MKSGKSSNRETLIHNKYLVYMQILGAFCVALIAGQYFNLFQISSDFLGVIIVNNFAFSIIIGFVGFLYLRKRLKEIEDAVD